MTPAQHGEDVDALESDDDAVLRLLDELWIVRDSEPVDDRPLR